MPFSFSLKLIRTKTNADGRNKWLDSGSMLHHQHASTLSVDMKNNKFTFTIPLTRFSISKTICFLLGFFCDRVEILKKFFFASSSFPIHPTRVYQSRFAFILFTYNPFLALVFLHNFCLLMPSLIVVSLMFTFHVLHFFIHFHLITSTVAFAAHCLRSSALSEKASWHVSQQYLHHSLPVMSTEIEKLCSRVFSSRCQLFHHVIMAANKRRSGPGEATLFVRVSAENHLDVVLFKWFLISKWIICRWLSTSVSGMGDDEMHSRDVMRNTRKRVTTKWN